MRGRTEGNLPMHEARSGNDHRVDVVDRGSPVSGPFRKSELRRLLLGQRRVAVDQNRRLGLERIIPEDPVHRLNGKAMNAADEARPDQSETHDAPGHRHPLTSSQRAI